MTNHDGFLRFERHDRKYLPVTERVDNYREFTLSLEADELNRQARRCLLPSRLPGRQHHSGFQRTRLRW